MLTPPAGLAIYVATRTVDYRKGADGLALLVQSAWPGSDEGRCDHTPGLAGSHTGGRAGGIEKPLSPRALRASDGLLFENRRQSIKIDKLPDDLA
jgi:hypothetical protein